MSISEHMMSKILYHPGALCHDCPKGNQCLPCALGELSISLLKAADAFESLGRAFSELRSVGDDCMIRPWSWRSQGFRRNRSYRSRPHKKSDVIPFESSPNDA